jgi:hypothetical protein
MHARNPGYAAPARGRGGAAQTARAARPRGGNELYHSLPFMTSRFGPAICRRWWSSLGHSVMRWPKPPLQARVRGKPAGARETTGWGE